MNEKCCNGCFVNWPTSMFYAHKLTSDGLSATCKTCVSVAAKKRYEKDREKIKAWVRRYVKRNKDDVLKRQAIYRDRNREKLRALDRVLSKTEKRKAAKARYNKKHRRAHIYGQAATDAVGRAIASGKMVRPLACQRCLCLCKPQGHHDDHRRQLDVMWLCPICHAARHKELRDLRKPETHGKVSSEKEVLA